MSASIEGWWTGAGDAGPAAFVVVSGRKVA